MQIQILDPQKRCFGLSVANSMYLCTLVELPSIVEAMKTLDYNTFYKSVDAAQMLYVHNKCIEEID
jgi:TATA-binding protein-associated factor Taf7